MKLNFLRKFNFGKIHNLMARPFIGKQRTYWTAHSRAKMRFYGLSESRVRRVINSPKRIEEGIAPDTVAMMQPASVKTAAGRPGGKREETWNQEIWVMLQRTRVNADETQINADNIRVNPRRNPRGFSVVKVISTWRYPGKTRPGQPIPAEILREIKSFL